ncbi:MAG: transcriptional activator NhaR [Polyangiaceae bacterium]
MLEHRVPSPPALSVWTGLATPRDERKNAAMDWLNYHHLLYFYVTAKEGGVTAASKRLKLAQPTVSGQLRQLEDALGGKLFERVGRRLVLTGLGELVFQYAEEIFALGGELMAAVRSGPTKTVRELSIGATAALPKLAVFSFVEPALRMEAPVHMSCREDTFENLLAALALHTLDLVLTDRPVGPGLGVKAFNHLLGESGVSFYAESRMATRLRRGFPRSLDGAPLLMPGKDTALFSNLERWFEGQGIRPHWVAEVHDSALIKVFGQSGLGVFAVPSVVDREVRRQYRVSRVGRLDDVREKFYAITVERRISHPGVVEICRRAKEMLAA